ncbi:hypothetical protein NtRootA4_04490 [Arthrobacter sp. NtRootA4]|nr:hypothetical protein NtRootA2_06720 [Arthrobacter sp. NtRootA2]BCW13470.1 hypothetical protein NtRootA4_04490 [Arthrobacter sp. NtRootA4]BCW21806.1 hypothetical protein NtRootC7_06730 [Arthrobacter sp. NtRootC7]BCW26073.1 hypothetical protein NtRootC45_06730 [Arthrobacter sp. NtRootC45]BCW30343.1 hypothetical protein NtRootD5_06740 [Arthrobacter sp. NtRootD5]
MKPMISRFVANDRVFSIVQTPTSDIRRTELTITLSGAQGWDFVVPGWRDVSFGISGEIAYVWSARSIIALPSHKDADPKVIPFDEEDLLVVFVAGPCWLLVCETSMWLIGPDGERGQAHFREVVEEASFDGHIVIVRDVDSAEYRFEVSATNLIEIIDS